MGFLASQNGWKRILPSFQVIEKYNNCRGKNQYVKQKEHVKTSFAVMAGLALPLMVVLDRYHIHEKGIGLNHKYYGDKILGDVSPTFGLNYEIRLPRLLHLGLELNLTPYHVKDEITYQIGTVKRVTNIDVKMLGLHLNTYGLYTYNRSNVVKPYAKLGVGFNYFVKNDYNQTVKEDNQQVEENPVVLKKADVLPFLGLGIKTRHIALEARFEVGARDLFKEKQSPYRLNFYNFSLWGIYGF